MADMTLEIVEGTQAGRQVPLDAVVDVGRDTSLPLHLDEDTQVSRRHARFTAQNGRVVVEDLGSTNGTYVNEQPIHSPRQLNPGDRVRVGLTVIELRSAVQVQQRASAVQPRPQFTEVGNQVLEQVPEQQLAPVPPEPVAVSAAGQPPLPPEVRAQETPPAYVPAEVVGDPTAEADYQAVARLVDTKVKQQRNVVVFAMLAAAALAVILYFGVT